jgi:hypothetical protein
MTGTATLPRTEAQVPARRTSRLSVALPDALIAVALATIAFIVRRHVPADGLFYDDAWQALGAWKGSPSELITVGQTQPGFTAGLVIWTRLFGMSTAALVTPALIAGTIGPPALFIGLRQFGFSRSIALLAGAALSSAQVHIEYSYHVKTYTFDVLIVLGLALTVWYLARVGWRTSIAAAWFIGSIAVGSFSSIALIATVVAGLILVLHPSGDRKLRVFAVAAQLFVLAMLSLASSRTYSYERIHGFFASREGYIDFDANPVTFSREVFNHFWHVADVYPGGVATLSLALAGVGLLVAAWRGTLAVPARFLALMVVVAVGGSIVELIPFGPPRALGRVSLWLVPAMAVGMCGVLEIARRRVGVRLVWRAGFDAIVCAAAVLVLVSSFGTDHRYAAGARSAIRRAMAEASAGDAVIITWPTTYSFALYADTPVDLRATPERSIGFLPAFADQRLHLHDYATTPDEFNEFVEGVDRVYVVHAIINTRGQSDYLVNLGWELALRGFRPESTRTIETGRIDVWHRQATAETSGSRSLGDIDTAPRLATLVGGST